MGRRGVNGREGREGCRGGKEEVEGRGGVQAGRRE